MAQITIFTRILRLDELLPGPRHAEIRETLARGIRRELGRD